MLLVSLQPPVRPPTRWHLLLGGALLVFALLLGSCTPHDEGSSSTLAGQPSADPKAGLSLAFVPAEVLRVPLGATVQLQARVTPVDTTKALHDLPPSSTSIRFDLLGEVEDASLDTPNAQPTDATGTAKLALHAPSSPAMFRVRASLEGGPSIERFVVASGDGFASLEITPSYVGKRPVQSWVAVVIPKASCKDFQGFPTQENLLRASASPSATLMIPYVPTGIPLAIAVRSAHSITGCGDVTKLTVNESRKITISVNNVPISLQGVRLDVAMDISLSSDTAAAWGAMVERWAKRFANAYAGAPLPAGGALPSKGARALLDTMESSLLGQQLSEFQKMRKANGWDAKLNDLFQTTGGPDVAVSDWLVKAVASLRASPGSIQGRLQADTTAGSGSIALARFSPTHLISLESSSDLTLTPVEVMWTAGPDDAISIAASSLSFPPSRVMEHEVDAAAVQSDPQASSALQALATRVPCDQVALLVQGFDSLCDNACVQNLCVQSMAHMWGRAAHGDENPTSSLVATVSFTVSGPASHLDDRATLAGFQGLWVGVITDPGKNEAMLEAKVKGTANTVRAP